MSLLTRRARRGASLRSRERESGAVLVEAAMILPLVIILFMGIIDFGLAIADFNSLRQGNREAVRRAVVGDVGDTTGCATGEPSDTDKLVCLTKEKTGLDASKVKVKVVFDENYVEGDALILCTQYPLHSITGFFGWALNDKVVHAQVDMRIEKDSLSDFGEYPEPGGGSWDWCV